MDDLEYAMKHGFTCESAGFKDTPEEVLRLVNINLIKKCRETGITVEKMCEMINTISDNIKLR